MTALAGVHLKAAELGKHAVHMVTQAGSGHSSSALSIAHLVIELMYRRMRWDPSNPRHAAGDRLVLSEGHAVPIVYAAMADLKTIVGGEPGALLAMAELSKLRDRDSVLDGHPNPAEGMPFFDAATGSLGQGLSVAAGLGLAARLDRTGRRVYCIVGDGESREGQIWEALDFIVDHQLINVCAIFNCNNEGQAGYVSPQQSGETLAKKLAAFGWDVMSIDGHDPGAISAAFDAFEKSKRPFAIVAKTVKGWGVDALQKGNWHGKPLPNEQLSAAYESLDRFAKDLASGAAPLPAVVKNAPQGAARIDRPRPAGAAWPSMTDALSAAGLESALKSRKLASRRAYGMALKVAGDLLPQVCAVDGDVSNSTFAEIFAKAHPDRFFECKIAEQNMVSVAVGLAAAGYIPFANSFAKFLSRAYDQIEMANITRANIKLVGSHSGISLAADGPSQMGLVDVAFFRAFGTVRGDDRRSPLCWSLQPADAFAAFGLTRAMIETPGMCYMRTHRPDVAFLYDDKTQFDLGGFHVLRGGDDVALVASGYMVHEALAAAEELAKQSIRAAVIDAYCLPIDEAALVSAIVRCGGVAVTCEDNYGGGLSSAVAEAAARAGGLRVESVHCSRIPKSCRTPEDVLDYCGVRAHQIADRALSFLRRPS
ncbi:MAG: transketolase [Phycisphaerales bacterium]|nr:transketolase [Phycisphaerales bacterium]